MLQVSRMSLKEQNKLRWSTVRSLQTFRPDTAQLLSWCQAQSIPSYLLFHPASPLQRDNLLQRDNKTRAFFDSPLSFRACSVSRTISAITAQLRAPQNSYKAPL